MPRVVMFSPITPGATSKPAPRSAAISSACSRCTWRRLGCVGSRATRERCLTVTPRCASPATPRPSSRRMLSCVGLLKRCCGQQATATTLASDTALEAALDEAREERGAVGGRRVVEVIRRIVQLAAVAAVADLDVGAGHLLHHEAEILRPHAGRLLAVDILFTHQLS